MESTQKSTEERSMYFTKNNKFMRTVFIYTVGMCMKFINI